jgi:hypothetical protein
MGKTHSDDPLHQHTSEIVDAILGPNEDFLDEEHCQEFLLALGIDPTTLLSEFKEHLEETARNHQSESGGVPNSIVGALRVVRGRIQSSNSLKMDPNAHINMLLSGGLNHQPAGTFARAFRRDGDDELCAEDQKLLDDLETGLGGDQDTNK